MNTDEFLTPDQIKHRLANREEVAVLRRTKLTPRIIRNLFRGVNANYSEKTLRVMTEYFKLSSTIDNKRLPVNDTAKGLMDRDLDEVSHATGVSVAILTRIRRVGVGVKIKHWQAVSDYLRIQEVVYSPLNTYENWQANAKYLKVKNR